MTKPDKVRRPATRVESRDGYTLIHPRNVLRAKALVPANVASPIDMDAIERAERALRTLSAEFSGWMEQDVFRLLEARDEYERHGPRNGRLDAIYRVAHDIKGNGTTFGYPFAAQVAEALCLILKVEPITDVPLILINQMVDAIRAIVRQRATGVDDVVAKQLATRLQTIAREFLKPDLAQARH